MDTSTLLLMQPRELALHLRHTSKEQSAKRVSSDLLKAIELEALPPTVFDTFLTSVEWPCPLRDALWQRYSKHVRYAAIRRFGKALKGIEWLDAWQEVGGTEGLLDLFSHLSVLEVKELCLVIGLCPGRPVVKNHTERQCRVTELIQCLMCSLYPSSPHKSKDHRPLNHHYARMVPACTSDFVESLICQQPHPLLESLPKKGLFQYHFELLRRLLLNSISREKILEDFAADRILVWLPRLLQDGPSVPAVEPRFSTSMSLAVTILERIAVAKKVLSARK